MTTIRIFTEYFQLNIKLITLDELQAKFQSDIPGSYLISRIYFHRENAKTKYIHIITIEAKERLPHYCNLECVLYLWNRLSESRFHRSILFLLVTIL